MDNLDPYFFLAFFNTLYFNRASAVPRIPLCQGMLAETHDFAAELP
jgi:hypothetical protein